ncbi:MAG: ABC transporter ATP-binding protein [Candidatus Shapirobacteria bacterium]
MPEKRPNNNFKLFKLARPYLGFILLILAASLVANGLNLFLPKVVAQTIDTFRSSNSIPVTFIRNFSLIIVFIFIFSTIQSLLQTYLSEKFARDLREKLITKISNQPYLFINQFTSEKLLTNLTADVDNIKQVVAQALIQIFASVITIVGATVLLLSINWRLALIVLTIIPLIVAIFTFIFSKIRKYFLRSQAIIDKLNKVINESIIASSLIRIINSQDWEFQKFSAVSQEAREVGLSILKLFSSLVPLIGLIANASIVAILLVGGKSIVLGTFTIGGFTAFMSYISMLIFPIVVLGFISNLIARAAVSFERVEAVLDAPVEKLYGDLDTEFKGNIVFENVNLTLNDKQILKNISFNIKANCKTAILGPTAAGKSQIFYLISGLIKPNSGQISIDNQPIFNYSQECLSRQIGLVFQDSSIFNTTIAENINFNNHDDPKSVNKAIATAELENFIDTLPQGLNTKIDERGNNLSGGQKQRITLARALALNPKILLLDDFTARVDKDTEKRITANLNKNYPQITEVLITQQISSAKDADQIILVMEGEILATGTHDYLLKNSSEYQQIYNSQQDLT